MKLFVKIKNNPLNPQTSKQASKQKPWTITWSLFQVHSFIMLSPSSFSSYPAHTQQTIMSSVLACELQLICCLFWVFSFNTLLPIVKWKILLPLEKFKVSLSIRVCCSCSVAQSCPTLCDTMDCNMPGVSVLNHLLDLAQTHVRRVDDAIQPCYPLSSPSPSASIFPSIRVFWNESFFTLGGQSIGVSASTSVPPMNIQGSFPLGLTGLISLQSKEFSRVFSNTTLRRCEDILKKNFSLWNPSITHNCAGRLSLSSMRLASLASHYLS